MGLGLEGKILETRPYKAGKALGEAIIEMVNLMYQNATAFRFLQGLEHTILHEIDERLNQIKKEKPSSE